MPPRTRSASSSVQQGYWRRFGSTFSGGAIVREVEAVDDLVGHGDCSHFLVNRWEADGGKINQSVDGGYFAAYFSNYIADGTGDGSFPHLTPVGEVPVANESAIRAINRTSPSRPYVDIPANVLQLGELTTLMRDMGRDFLSNMSRQHLRNEFGIKPIVGDLVKLLRFNDQVDRRVQEIDKLVTGKGLRRTVDIGFYEAKVNDTYVFQSQGAYISGQRFGHTRLGIRAHTRWNAESSPALGSPKSVRGLARQAVSGMTIDFATLWEICPWSWLIDWGYDLGSYLKANRNIVPATLSQCVVMEHTKTNWVCPATPPGDYGRFMSNFNFFRETKRRLNPIIAPSAHFPFLSGSQMGIVSSLAVAKGFIPVR
jgi:hypothetical protein